MLTLNLNLLYTVVNILVLFLLLRKFLYKPVMNIIAQRQKQVDDALNAAETSKQEAVAALNDAQAKLRNVDAEAAARRTAYEQQAEKDKQQLLADAQKQADAILAEGKVAAEAERLGLADLPNVLYLGYVSDGAAKALMAHCKAFLFPTLYEGFGIPPLEAAACGAPQIIVSDTPCMREVYGPCAAYIDLTANPGDVDDVTPATAPTAALLEK